MLARLLPLSVLESHTEMTAESERRYGGPSALVYGAYGPDELRNDFLARSHAAGKAIAFAQHGGGYRQFRTNPVERLELRPGTATFVSWGWRGPGARPTASPHLSRLRDTHEPGGDRTVLIEVAFYRYPQRFASQPLGSQTHQLGQDLLRFVQAVRDEPAARRLVLKRYPPAESIGAIRQPEVAELPHEAFGTTRASEWMRRARTVVVSYPDSTFIEAMVIGVPTIGFWDPEIWQMRDDAAPFFDALAAAGVVCATPEDAAARLEQIEDDPGWWQAREVQDARLAVHRPLRPLAAAGGASGRRCCGTWRAAAPEEDPDAYYTARSA